MSLEKYDSDMYNAQSILTEYLSVTGSTTDFINYHSNVDMKVKVLEQLVKQKLIIRKSILYTRSQQQPILFASGVFYINSIKKRLVEKLIEGKLPVGEIFGNNTLKKENEIVKETNDPDLLEQLKTTEPECCIRKFDLVYGRNRIAVLTEAVNSETLQRIFA